MADESPLQAQCRYRATEPSAGKAVQPNASQAGIRPN